MNGTGGADSRSAIRLHPEVALQILEEEPDFIKLMLFANLVGWPLAYAAAGKWLENFAYRIDLTPWVFLAAAGLSLAIALYTTGFRAIRAALRLGPDRHRLRAHPAHRPSAPTCPRYRGRRRL